MAFNYTWTDLHKGVPSTTEINIKCNTQEWADKKFIEFVGSKASPKITQENFSARVIVKNLSEIYKAKYIRQNFKLMQFAIV